jgi:hypothetical protein
VIRLFRGYTAGVFRSGLFFDPKRTVAARLFLAVPMQRRVLAEVRT